MQYHYVVGYNSDKDSWFVDQDRYSYFPDGSVWDNKQDEWFSPKEGSAEEELDFTLLRILEYCVPDILPTPAILQA